MVVAAKPRSANTGPAMSRIWRRRCSAGRRMPGSGALLQRHLVAIDDAGVLAPQLVEAGLLVGAERQVGSGRVFAHLVGRHAGGEDRSEVVEREDAGDRRLRDRPPGLGRVQVREGVGLVEEVEHVVAVAMRAVVALGELGVAGDLAGEHVGGVRHPRDQADPAVAVSYTHLRAHETDSYLVCRLLLEKKKK